MNHVMNSPGHETGDVAVNTSNVRQKTVDGNVAQCPTGARTAFTVLLDLLNQFEQQHIQYRLAHHREEAVMIEAAVPGERWEVEVFEDGHIEFERFRSDGHIGDAEEFHAELAKHME
jgi:hypothetical protein